MPNQPMRVRPDAHLRALAGALVASACGLACAATLLLFVLVHFNRELGGNRDFVVYWATGQQLAHHGNPYDAKALETIEYGAGLPHRYGVGYMRNPPWALPLAWPFGWMSLRAAAVLGSLVLLAALGISMRILLGVYACRNRMVALVIGLCAPALICLILGQTSILVLLGIALFLRFHRSQPFAAGAALWLCALKPHLLLPVAVVFVGWAVLERQYRIMAGGAAAFLASVLVTLWLDPQAWAQYVRMAGYSGVETDPIPSLSVLLRTHAGSHWMWLQFLPAALACAWALGYFWQRRHGWDWAREIPLLLLVSLVAAPYAYLNDHVVVIPALLFATARDRSRVVVGVLALASAVLEVAFLAHVWSPAPIYWATVLAAPFWLAWYLAAVKRRAAVAADVTVAAPAQPA